VQNLISTNEAPASPAAYLDQVVWRQLQEAATFEAFAQAWLSLQCTLVNGTRRALVVAGTAEQGPYAPVAYWPENKRGSVGLISAADLAIEERRGVLRDPSYGSPDPERPLSPCHIAYPFLIDGRLHGAVAVELAGRSENEMRTAMRSLQWGIAWIEAWLRRTQDGQFSPASRRLSEILELVTASVETARFSAAATAVVTQIATSLRCERVSLGFVKGKHIKVHALSHSAQFARRSNLIESIGSTMDEAMDQRSTLVFPAAQDALPRTLYNHARLSNANGGCALCTVPLVQGGNVIGALTFERPGEVGFDIETVEFCEAAAVIVGPILAMRRRDDQWITRKVLDSCRAAGKAVLGPGHLSLKLSLFVLAATIVFLSLASGSHRVAADSRVEGLVQRVVAAPINGYVTTARFRAGDVVRKNETLAQLDDRDLLLERAKWASQRQQHLQEYHDALAKSNRADIAVLQTQIGQADAELALVEEKLARTRLAAPFDGIVVSGDLTQSLGSPVTQGDVLFKVAPLDAYRVILEVDERDMAGVRIGAPGKLVLTGESASVLAFHVDKITLVSEAREGRNFFRVEAKLAQTPRYLRPGMKGVGKIEIGERKLIWIWTHSLVDWLKLALWSYWP
jgi:multidrug resistance efflux pump